METNKIKEGEIRNQETVSDMEYSGWKCLAQKGKLVREMNEIIPA